MGARKGEVRETGRGGGGGPGIGEATLAEGEGHERGRGEEWVGERAVGGQSETSRARRSPAVRSRNQASAAGTRPRRVVRARRKRATGPGWEASARETVSGRAAQGAPAADAAWAMEGRGAAGSSRSSRRSGVPHHASRQRGETGEHGGARGLGGIEAGDDRREELKREVADKVLAAGIASHRRRHLNAGILPRFGRRGFCSPAEFVVCHFFFFFR